MGIEKDLSGIKQNPKGMRFKELEEIILGSRFKRVNNRGRHYVYKQGDRIQTVVKPHGGHKHCHWLKNSFFHLSLARFSEVLYSDVHG